MATRYHTDLGHKAAHDTLVADTVSTETLTADTGRKFRYVYVALPDADGDAYFTVAVDGATATTPTVAGDNTWAIGQSRFERTVALGEVDSVQVKIISSSAIDYAIKAV